MQNKANFGNDKISISSFLTGRYEIFPRSPGEKTNPIQTQFKPNLTQNQANSNPIKANLSKGQI
jgi:hypothetical protein